MAGSLVGRRKLVGIALGMVRFLINGIFLEDLAVMGRVFKRVGEGRTRVGRV